MVIMVKISVIVPVFNSEEYLTECLDSILNQTFSDIEIICVDDGSDDNSLNILKDYHKKDNRIKIISQENKGLSATRNVALENAAGDYIAFIDSDDYFELNALEDLYYKTTLYDADFTMSKLLNFDDKTGKSRPTPYFDMKYLKEMVGEKPFNYSDVNDVLFKMCVTAPGKLFRKDFIENIRFEEGLLFEDSLFFIKCMLKADKVYFHDEYIYNRRNHDSSITNSYFDQFSDVLIIYDKIAEELRKNNVYDEVKVQFFNSKCQLVFMRFKQVKDKTEFFNLIKTDFLTKKYDSVLNECNERSRCIYESAVSSNTALEFELQVRLYDSNVRIKKLKRENKKLKTKNNKLKDKNESLLNSTSWKITEPFRDIKNFFKE